MNYYIAAASEDGEYIDSHFGHAKIYQILSVEEETGDWNVADVVEIDIGQLVPGTGGGCHGQNAEVIEAIAKKLSGCDYILVSKIGPFPQKLLSRFGFICLETDDRIGEAVKKINAYQKRQRK